MFALHQLPASRGKKKKRVGRGNASGGNYSGRGIKGQRARSGGKGGLKLRGLKQSFMALPKTRGFSSVYPRAQAVNVQQLSRVFAEGSVVTPQELFSHGLIKTLNAPVKILGVGSLEKKLTIRAHAASKSALAAVQKAGGTFEQIDYTRTKS